MTSTEEKPAPIIFGDESLSDCTLVVDNQDFKIHKMILAARSEVFKAMFYGDFKESKEDRVEIKDASVETFRRFLEIIYTSKVSDPGFILFPYKSSGGHKTIKLKEKDIHKNTVNIHYTESFEKYFHDFWKNTTELINVADRFDLSSIVKYYLATVMEKEEELNCKNKECHVCFNYEALRVIHSVSNSSRNGWYTSSIYLEWMKYAPQLPFSSSISVERLGCLKQTVNFSG